MGMTLDEQLMRKDDRRCQWDNPLFRACYFASTEIGVIGLERAGFHTPDDPLRIKDNLALLTNILTV